MDCGGLRMENVGIANCDGHGLYLRNSQGGSYVNVKCVGNHGDGLRIDNDVDALLFETRLNGAITASDTTATVDSTAGFPTSGTIQIESEEVTYTSKTSITLTGFSEVYLACQEERRPETIRDKMYVFVHVPESRFFGFEEITVLGRPVQMATTERALLDALDRPRYAGGIGEVSRIVARASSKLLWDALLKLAHIWGSSALVQRLGYFVDLHRVDVPDNARVALLELVRPQSKIQLGSRRRWGTTGKLVRPWNVVENVPRDVLISKDETPRRRVVLAKKEQNP